MMNESESPELIAKKNLFEIWSKGADFQRLREREDKNTRQNYLVTLWLCKRSR